MIYPVALRENKTEFRPQNLNRNEFVSHYTLHSYCLLKTSDAEVNYPLKCYFPFSDGGVDASSHLTGLFPLNKDILF